MKILKEDLKVLFKNENETCHHCIFFILEKVKITSLCSKSIKRTSTKLKTIHFYRVASGNPEYFGKVACLKTELEQTAHENAKGCTM